MLKGKTIKRIVSMSIMAVIIFSLLSTQVFAFNSWAPKNDLSIGPRFYGAAAQLNGDIYVLGGYSSMNPSSVTNTVVKYNQSTDSWVTKSGMTAVRRGFAVTQSGGKLYAVGGINTGSYEGTLEEYDPNDTSNGYASDGSPMGKWTFKSNMPTPRHILGATAVNGKIYTLGGLYYNGSSEVMCSIVEEYDPYSNSWATKQNMINPRGAFTAVTLNGKIYAIGGYSNTSILGTVEEYDPNDTSNGYDIHGNPMGKWVTKANLPTPRKFVQVVVSNNKIYAIGGYDDNYVLNTVEEYDPTDTSNGYDANGNPMGKWTTRTGMTNARTVFEAAATGDSKIYAISGENSGYTPFASVEEYTPLNYTPPITIPPVPVNLTATPASSQITLNWNPSSGATNYYVYRGMSQAGPFAYLGGSAMTSFTDTGLVNGTTYYYVVTALNLSGESGYSNVVWATPSMVAPGAPANLIAAPGNSMITLNWNPSSGATSYNIKKSMTPAGPFTTCGSSVTPNYTDPAVINGTTYYYVVTAVFGGIESSNSNMASATPFQQTGNRAILTLHLSMGNNSEIKNYDLTKADADAFVGWYDNRSTTGTGPSYYAITYSFGPYPNKKDYIPFYNIFYYEVAPY